MSTCNEVQALPALFIAIRLILKNLEFELLPSTASCEVGECPLRLIQNMRRSLAISSSIPWALALLQKYVSHAYKMFKDQMYQKREFCTSSTKYKYVLSEEILKARSSYQAAVTFEASRISEENLPQG